MTPTWTGDEKEGDICHVPADSTVFKQQAYYSFLQIERVVGYKIDHFPGRHKFMTP